MKNVDLNKKVNKVTNVGNDDFTIKENDKTYRVSELVKNLHADEGTQENMHFFRMSLISGGVADMPFNLRLKNVDVLPFSRQVQSYFYFLVKSDVSAYGDIITYKAKDDEKEKADCLEARYNNAIAICNNGGAMDDVTAVSTAAGNVAKLIFGSKIADYPLTIRHDLDLIVAELKRVYNLELVDETNVDHDFQIANIRELRKLITKMMVDFFPWDKDGIVKRFNYRCSDVLARDVYSLYVKTKGMDKNGNIKTKISGDSEILRNVLLTCVQSVQIENTNK